MKNLAIKNAGYLLVFCPQILLVVSANARLTWIPLVFFFILLPIMRYLIGDDFSQSNKSPSKLLLMYLNAIPRLYGLRFCHGQFGLLRSTQCRFFNT
jgi:hypothetical protein